MTKIDPASLPLPRAAWIIALVSMFLLSVRTITNFDFWQHVTQGTRVISEGIRGADTLTWMSSGQSAANPTWLYDVLMAGLHGMAGASGAVLVHALLIVLAFAILVPFIRKTAGDTAIAVGLLMLTWVVAGRFEPRAATFVLWIPALFFALMERQDAPLKKLLIVLLPLQILWTNAHPSFLAGPLMACAYGVAARMAGPAAAKRAKTCFTLAAALAACTLLTPFPGAAHAALFQRLNLEGGLPLLWTAPPFSLVFDRFDYRPTAMPTNFVLGIGAIGLVFYKGKLPVARILIVVLGALMAVMFHENAFELFPILVFPFLCTSLDAIGSFIHSLAAGRGGGRNPVVTLASATIACFIGAGFAFSAITNTYYINRASTSSFGLGANNDLIHRDALPVLHREDFPKHFLHLPFDGAWLGHNLPADRKIHTDMRLRLHGSAALTKYVKALSGEKPEEMQALFSGENAPTAIVLHCAAPQIEEVAGRLLSSGAWANVYFDGTSLILAKRTPENQALINDVDIKRKGLEHIEQARKAYSASLGGLVSAPIPARLIGAATVFTLFQQYPEAVGLYSLLQSGNKNMPRAWIQKGLCLMQMNEKEKALAVFDEATSRWPKNLLGWLYTARILEDLNRKPEAADALRRAKELGYKDAAESAPGARP